MRSGPAGGMLGGKLVGGLAAKAAGYLVGRPLPAPPASPDGGDDRGSRPVRARSDAPPSARPVTERSPGSELDRGPAPDQRQAFVEERRDRPTSSQPVRDRRPSADRGRTPRPTPPSPVYVDRSEVERVAGAAGANRFERRFREAARAFDQERYGEALPKLRSLASEAPTAASVRELYGLALYRVGRYQEAAVELETFAHMTHSAEQHPVLADCYRALRRWDDVERCWEELREASPSSQLVNEGRIVMAGAWADRGELNKAVAVLAKGFKVPNRLQPHHLRRMYVLADLQERTGALAEARTLFRQIAGADPDFFDVTDRVRALG